MTSCAEAGPGGVVVAAVRQRTPAARAGLRSGDRIVAINGERLRDVIDFHFHAGQAQLRLAVERSASFECLGDSADKFVVRPQQPEVLLRVAEHEIEPGRDGQR